MKKIYLKPAEIKNLDRLMAVVADAQASLKADGVPQWQDGYPDVDNIKSDIQQGQLYEVLVDDQIAGMVAIQTEPEPNYDQLKEGAWHAEDKYGTIHRLAIDRQFAGHGLGKLLFSNAFTLLRQQGITNIRIDTHEENFRMRGLIEKVGFKYCGVVAISDPHCDLLTLGYDLVLQ